MNQSNFKHFPTLLKTRVHYRRLVIGGMISQLGDWLSYIALSSIALRIGDMEGMVGAGVAVASVYIAHSLPHVFAAPIVGPMVDRFNRRTIMIGAYLAAGLVTLGMYALADSGSLWLIQGLLCLRVMISNAGMTARQASLPALVTSDELSVANALNSSVWSALFTIGVALGGLVTSILGPSGALAIDALTYILSAACIWSLPALLPEDSIGKYAQATLKDPDDPDETATSGEANTLSEVSEPEEQSELNADSHTTLEDESSSEAPSDRGMGGAIAFIRSTPKLWAPIFAKSPIECSHGLGWIALNVIAAGSGPEESSLLLGVYTAVRGLGIGVGPALLGVNRSVSFVGVQLITLGAVTTFILSDMMWLSLVALLVWGMSGGVNWVGSTVMLQRHTPPHLLGRVTSLDFLGFMLFQSVATLSAGWIYDQSQSLTDMLVVIGGLGGIGIVILSVLEYRARAQFLLRSER